MRDVQRKKFWVAARKLPISPYATFATTDDIQEFIYRILATNFAKNSSDDIEEIVVETKIGSSKKVLFVETVDAYHKNPDRTTTWVGYPTRMEARFKKEGVTDIDVIVSVCYAIVRRHKLWRFVPVEWHGWQLAHSVCAVIAEIHGDDHAARAREIFVAEKVAVAPRRSERQISLKSRSELTTRLKAHAPEHRLSSVALHDRSGEVIGWVATAGLSRTRHMTTNDPSLVKVWGTHKGADSYRRQLRGRGILAEVIDAPPLLLSPRETSNPEEIVWSLSAERDKEETADLGSLQEQRSWEALGITSRRVRRPMREEFEGGAVDELEKLIEVCNRLRVTPSLLRVLSREFPMRAEDIEKIFLYRLCRIPRDYVKIPPYVSAALNRLYAQRTRREILTPSMFAGSAVFASLASVLGYDDWTSRALIAALISRPNKNQSLPVESVIGAPKGLHRTPILRKTAHDALRNNYFPAPEVDPAESQRIIENWSHPTPAPLHLPLATKNQSSEKPVHALWVPPVDNSHPTSIVVDIWELKHRLGCSWENATDEIYRLALTPPAA